MVTLTTKNSHHIYQSASRKPLNQEGKNSRTKPLKIQCPVTPYVLQYKHWCKKQQSKENKEATKYAKTAELYSESSSEKNKKKTNPPGLSHTQGGEKTTLWKVIALL